MDKYSLKNSNTLLSGEKRTPQNLFEQCTGISWQVEIVRVKVLCLRTTASSAVCTFENQNRERFLPHIETLITTFENEYDHS